MQQGIVQAICRSDRRGTEKTTVPEALLLENHGIEGDAHAGSWHRQVSLLSLDKVRAFNAQGAGVEPGAFGENLLVEGIDFAALPMGTRLQVKEALLELSQRGKECHSHCQIYHRMGDCIMPREGVFARVLRPGIVRVGDSMQVLPPETKLRAAVLVLSDRSASGQRADESGPMAVQMLADAGYQVEEPLVLPDEQQPIQAALIDLADRRQISLIITSGGTGFSPRDVTPEATLAVSQRLAPGIAEALRAHSMQKTPRAMLSRGVAVLRGQSLIVNLPGSPKAVQECLAFLLPHIPHGLAILSGQGDA